MSEKGKESEKVEHKNIYAALAAFQGENPQIARTANVQFTAGGKTVDFWYAPLNEVLDVVRPLTSKHGLAFTWEDTKEPGKMRCVLYHETYTTERIMLEEVRVENESSRQTVTTTYGDKEKNVIRSMPVEVKRAGDMKTIGGDSTYGRRYTLGEVLGVSPDEDKDTEIADRAEKMEKVIFTNSKEGIRKAKTLADLEKPAEIFAKDLAMIVDGKTPSLGLTKENYEELQQILAVRKAELEKAGVGKGAPGENKDGGGDATVGK